MNRVESSRTLDSCPDEDQDGEENALNRPAQAGCQRIVRSPRR